MRCITVFLCLGLTMAGNASAVDVMDTELNAYRAGALISKKFGTVEETVVFGDAASTVLAKIKAKPSKAKRKDDSWSISYSWLSSRPPLLYWLGGEEPGVAEVLMLGTEEAGLAEIRYAVYVGVGGSAEASLDEIFERVVKVYRWVCANIGEPVESPANLADRTNLSAVWLADNDVVVHMVWHDDDPSNAFLDIVSPSGPSAEEFKWLVEAHRPQFTMEDFMKIQVGMNLDEVVETIGSQGELQVEEFVDGQVVRTYGWTNGDGSGASIVVNPDGIVIRKTQEGLK